MGIKLQKAERPKLDRAAPGLADSRPQLARTVRPDFGSLFDPQRVENPLADLTAVEDPEENADNEVSAAYLAIQAEKKARRDNFRTMVDPEFWCALCFQNREQKERFLQTVGWFDLGDKYLDGLAVAKRLGISIEPIPLEAKSVRQAPKRLREVEEV